MPFILRRLAFYLVATWVALTINFFIPRAIPGNAVQSVMAKFPNLQPSAYRALENLLGVGHPGSIWNQYVSYLDDVFHFNFGTDVSQYPASVSSLLVQTLPWTITLVGTVCRMTRPGGQPQLARSTSSVGSSSVPGRRPGSAIRSSSRAQARSPSRRIG